MRWASRARSLQAAKPGLQRGDAMSYECYRCGKHLSARTVVKNGSRTCYYCGAPLPRKMILRLYNADRRVQYRAQCSKCGRRYRGDLPTGDREIRCKACGDLIIRTRRTEIKGVEIPNYIDAVQKSKYLR